MKPRKKKLLHSPKRHPVLFTANSTFYADIKPFQQFTASRVRQEGQGKI